MSITCTHSETTEMIHHSYRARRPLYIAGPPGIGKSDCVKAACRTIAGSMNRSFVEWNRLQDVHKREIEFNTPCSDSVLWHQLNPPKVKVEKKEDPKNKGKFIETKKTIPAVVPMVKNEETGAKEVQGITDTVFLYCDVRVSQLDPSDLRGLPNLSGEADYVEWRPTLLFRVMSNPITQGFLFFDELSLAPPSVQAAAYQIILDRCIGEIAISDHVHILAAGNRAEDRANVFEMANPLKNRFLHITQTAPTIEEWTAWAAGAGVDSRVTAFLNFKPDYLTDTPEKIKQAKSSAFATPRSWEYCSDMIQGVNGTGSNEEKRRFNIAVSSAIGEGKAREFRAFNELTRKVDIPGILKDPSQVAEMKVDMRWALMSALSDSYGKDKKILEPIVGVCEHLQADFAVSLLRMLTQQDGASFSKRLLKCKNRSIILKYSKFFDGIFTK